MHGEFGIARRRPAPMRGQLHACSRASNCACHCNRSTDKLRAQACHRGQNSTKTRQDATANPPSASCMGWCNMPRDGAQRCAMARSSARLGARRLKEEEAASADSHSRDGASAQNAEQTDSRGAAAKNPQALSHHPWSSGTHCGGQLGHTDGCGRRCLASSATGKASG